MPPRRKKPPVKVRQRRPSLKRIFAQTARRDHERAQVIAGRDHLKQRISELVKTEAPYLPANNEQFSKCSLAIHQAANRQGSALLLPSHLLPPA